MRAKPRYADVLRMAHVHHTAGTNAYTRAQAPAIVRAIQTYHVKGNGWNDIGYNALVDRFGTVYEGRGGGIDRNVIGAHAGGFNTGSFGISVLGDFRTATPPAAAIDALVETLAWRLDLGHVDPLSTFNGISSGNERFGPGIPVFLRAISGHRDSSLTTCPGERLYAQLPALAKRVAALGLPKIYAPAATADEAGGTRLTAKLSSALPWSAVVLDAAGVELGRGQGTGARVDWTWLPQGPIAAGTRWRIQTRGATPAEGTFAATAPAATTALQLTGATASPATISPNGDGQADTTTIGFTLTANANVTVSLLDANGAAVAELEPRTWRRAGTRARWSSTVPGCPTGRTSCRCWHAAPVGGRRRSTSRDDHPAPRAGRALRGRADAERRRPGRPALAHRPALRSGDAHRAHPQGRPLGRDAAAAASFEAGDQVVTWDGTKRLGKAGDGSYVAAVEAVSADGTATARVELPFLLDGTAPTVRVVSAVPPRLRVSEAATLVVRANGARRLLRVDGPATIRIPRIERLRTLVVWRARRRGQRIDAPSLSQGSADTGARLAG